MVDASGARVIVKQYRLHLPAWIRKVVKTWCLSVESPGLRTTAAARQHWYDNHNPRPHSLLFMTSEFGI